MDDHPVPGQRQDLGPSRTKTRHDGLVSQRRGLPPDCGRNLGHKGMICWLVVWNSRGLNTFQLVRPSQLSVESSFLAFAMALTLEICLVLDVVVFVSSLESHLLRTRATGNLVKYSGLDSVTLIDAVVGRQFLVPSTACGASTMVLHPAVPSWANLFKQIDACSGLSQMDGQSVEVSDHQTQRVNYLQTQLPSQDQQLYGQIETQTRIQAMLETQLSHIWGVVSMRLREEGE